MRPKEGVRRGSGGGRHTASGGPRFVILVHVKQGRRGWLNHGPRFMMITWVKRLVEPNPRAQRYSLVRLLLTLLPLPNTLAEPSLYRAPEFWRVECILVVIGTGGPVKQSRIRKPQRYDLYTRRRRRARHFREFCHQEGAIQS
eukprot:9195414-Pyramimonas_sp.AAC.1